MSEDVYQRLRLFLDKLPGGYPATDSGVEIKILKKLFTPEEAEIAMNLSLMPEPVAAIAERSGMEESKAAELLESMARQGSILRLRDGDDVFYMAVQFVVGIYEFHLNTMDRELAELVMEYWPNLVKGTKQFRVVPIGSVVDATPAVANYERIRDLVKQHDLVSVATCICRRKHELLGDQCDRSFETCLQVGTAAQYYIENGLGRKISTEEALKILDLAEESALVLSPNNTQDILYICCCCSCCCGILRSLKSFDRPAEEVQSSFQARIDPDLCIACGTCIERCQMEAIREDDEVMKVNLASCIGCGLCVSTCPEEAMSLVPKTEVYVPPANIGEMTVKLVEEQSSG